MGGRATSADQSPSPGPHASSPRGTVPTPPPRTGQQHRARASSFKQPLALPKAPKRTTQVGPAEVDWQPVTRRIEPSKRDAQASSSGVQNRVMQLESMAQPGDTTRVLKSVPAVHAWSETSALSVARRASPLDLVLTTLALVTPLRSPQDWLACAPAHPLDPLPPLPQRPPQFSPLQRLPPFFLGFPHLSSLPELPRRLALAD